MAKRFKRTKGVDITGKWTSDENNNIIRYMPIKDFNKCSFCKGLDENCPICHGNSIDSKASYTFSSILLLPYKLIKKLIKK